MAIMTATQATSYDEDKHWGAGGDDGYDGDEHHDAGGDGGRGPMPRARASVSDYSWSAGRRQQPLVNFNEIKTCPALCLGSSLFFFPCVWKSVCVCVGGMLLFQHRRNLTNTTQTE